MEQNPPLDMSQSSPWPTSDDEDRMYERLSHAQDPSSLLPPAYTYITTAGSGTYGDVYFCLPASAITSAHTDITASSETSTVCTHLTKQLVAVKVCHGTSIPTLHNETRALQIIAATKLTAQAVACDSSNAFFAIIDHGPCLDSTVQFLTTSTLPVICSLRTLKHNFPSLPEVFTWLLYIKLADGLHWLANTCIPGITHGDLHLSNVLVGYSSLPHSAAAHGENAALPEIKIIDFGRSLLQDAQPGADYASDFKMALRKDQSNFLFVLAAVLGVDLETRRPSGYQLPKGSQEWSQVRTMVQSAVEKSLWDQEKCVWEIEQQWGEFAELQVERVQQNDAEKVLEAVMHVTGEQRGSVLAKIEELVRAE